MRVVRSLAAVLLMQCGIQLAWSEEEMSDAAAAVGATEVDGSADTQSAGDSAAAVDTADILRDDHPESYVVVKGDTLWDIANRFLKNPWMWPEIWHVNPQIANPHLIYPGDTIKLVYLEGGPRLTVKRGDAGMTYKMSPGDEASRVGGDGSVSSAGGDQKLHPAVRVMPLEEPIPAIPLDIIDPFLSRSRIVKPGELEAAPYVLQGSQRHVISGKGSELYAKGNFDNTNKVYGFFRKGKVYIDPHTNEVLGIQALSTGTGKLKLVEGDVGKLAVVSSTGEIRLGDRLLINQEVRVEPTFFPSAPEMDVHGEILDVEGGVTQVGAMSVIVVNLGEEDELQSGNVLAIYQRGEVVRDVMNPDHTVRLPEERAGLAMIFSTYDKLSYALVLYADRPLRVGDFVRKP